MVSLAALAMVEICTTSQQALWDGYPHAWHWWDWVTRIGCWAPGFSVSPSLLCSFCACIISSGPWTLSGRTVNTQLPAAVRSPSSCSQSGTPIGPYRFATGPWRGHCCGVDSLLSLTSYSFPSQPSQERDVVLELWRHWIQFWLHAFLATWPWAGLITFCLSFLICKVGLRIPTS